MMTINLARGFYNYIESHKVLPAYFQSFKMPNKRYQFSLESHLVGLPPINTVYNDCIRAGCSEEQTIDRLIELYFPVRYFRIGDFEKLVMVLGLVGPRGSGKSASAVIIASCDYLLRNLPVWSNIPIEIRVVYRDAEKIFQSKPAADLNILDLNEAIQGPGCVLVDEVNMEAAESTRAVSGANLAFSYALQQIRKRMLSVIWTTQGWMWIDNRLRWQTDYLIACRDAFLENKKFGGGIGYQSIWRVHDLSGLTASFDYDYEMNHRFINDFLIGKHLALLRPWWTAYQTTQLLGQKNYIQEYKISVKEKNQVENQNLNQPVNSEDLPEVSNTIGELVKSFVSSGVDRIPCDEVWKIIGEADKATQIKVGQLFSAAGYKRAGRSGSGRYWVRKEEVLDGTV